LLLLLLFIYLFICNETFAMSHCSCWLLSLLFIPLNDQNFCKKIPIQTIIKMSLKFHFELQFYILLKKLYSYYYAAEILFISHLISYFRLTTMFRQCPVCKSWNACNVKNCLKLAATKTC